MTAAPVEDRLRRFLLLLAVAICVATPVELWLRKHTGSAVQLIPFGLCAALCVSTTLTLAAPRRRVLVVHRIVSALVVAGGLFGLYEHLEENFAFEREIRPIAATGEVLYEALHGASPLLAPGILALAATLAIAGTYGHPGLGPRGRAGHVEAAGWRS